MDCFFFLLEDHFSSTKSNPQLWKKMPRTWSAPTFLFSIFLFRTAAKTFVGRFFYFLLIFFLNNWKKMYEESRTYITTTRAEYEPYEVHETYGCGPQLDFGYLRTLDGLLKIAVIASFFFKLTKFLASNVLHYLFIQIFWNNNRTEVRRTIWHLVMRISIKELERDKL